MVDRSSRAPPPAYAKPVAVTAPTAPAAPVAPTAPPASLPPAKRWKLGNASAARPAVPSGARPNLTGASAPAAVPEGFSSSKLRKELDQLTGSRSVPGNKVQLLFDGVQSFAERDRMIDGAKESICLQTFIFTSDDTGWELAHKLAEKAKQGVKVRVMYDAVGTGRSDPKMFQMMKDAGVDVRVYGEKWKVWDLNDRWHEKHLIVDGKASVEGGMNIANEYALGGSGKMVFSRGKVAAEAWRDVDLKLEGPAVADAMKAFVRNWDELGGGLSDADRAQLFPKLEAKPGGPAVRVVQQNPEVKGLEKTTHSLYLKAIDSAQKSITIENAYLLPPKDLREALVRAAQRGVDVKVLTNSKASNDFGFVSDAARYFYDELINAGVKIYEKQGGTLHSKTATFDGEFSIIGSVNLNGRSKTQDSEAAVAVQDDVTARTLETRFTEGLTSARAVSRAELKRESVLVNLKQWAFSTLAWTF